MLDYGQARKLGSPTHMYPVVKGRISTENSKGFVTSSAP